MAITTESSLPETWCSWSVFRCATNFRGDGHLILWPSGRVSVQEGVAKVVSKALCCCGILWLCVTFLQHDLLDGLLGCGCGNKCYVDSWQRSTGHPLLLGF